MKDNISYFGCFFIPFATNNEHFSGINSTNHAAVLCDFGGVEKDFIDVQGGGGGFTY